MTLRIFARDHVINHRPVYPPLLDGLDNVFEAAGTALLVPTYTGPLVRIRENAGNAEQDFYPDSTGFLNRAEIANFLAGAAGYVTTAYGQHGGMNWVQTSASIQPTIDILSYGDMPVLDFERNNSGFNASAGAMLDWARNRAAVSMVAAKQSGSQFGNHFLFACTNTANVPRVNVKCNTGGQEIDARTLDADATVTIARVPRIDPKYWSVHVARVDFANGIAYNRFGPAEASGALPSAGTSSNTASNYIRWGVGNGSTFGRKCTALVLFTDLLTDEETQNAFRRFRRLVPLGERGVIR